MRASGASICRIAAERGFGLPGGKGNPRRSMMYASRFRRYVALSVLRPAGRSGSSSVGATFDGAGFEVTSGVAAAKSGNARRDDKMNVAAYRGKVVGNSPRFYRNSACYCSHDEHKR